MDYNSYLNFPLKPQQVEYMDYVMEHHYCIIAAKQGNGKTLVGITTSLIELQHCDTDGLCVVVCPAFLKVNWKNEFKTFSKEEVSVKIVTGKNCKNIDTSSEDVLIVNYAILKKCEHLFKNARVVVWDESHYLLNPKAQRTKAAISYINKYKPNRVIQLTGTPNKGKGQQWYAPIFMCSINPRNTSGIDMRRHIFSYWDFQHVFCNKTIMNIGGRTVTQFDGLKNADKLKKLLHNKYLRGRKVDLGSITLNFKDVMVSFKKDKALEDAWESFNNGKKADEHVMSAKTSSATAKVKFTIDYVVNLLDQNEGPVVVYTDHLAPLEELVDGLRGRKLRVGKINGSTRMEDRQAIVDDFQAGKLDVFAATITSSNTGLTLTRARHMVLNDRNWDFTQNDQAYYRIFRIGQTEDCLIHEIHGSEVDKMIAKNLKKRQNIIEQIVKD